MNPVGDRTRYLPLKTTRLIGALGSMSNRSVNKINKGSEISGRCAHRHGHDISTEFPEVSDGHHDNNTHHGKDGRAGWSQWSEWSLCSRTCDGGVSRQLRTCSSPAGCRGEPVRYKICNMQPCRGNISLLEDDIWREQQCSAHDDTPYGGELFHWRAHRDDDEPCALTCRGTPQHSGQTPEAVDYRCSDGVDKDMRVLGVRSWKETASDRLRWRNMLDQAKAYPGP
ncbi:jg15522 [Pararge aegeria aegeria]|uniref:Jg15522 protein n=1 Tax=Pararge aegeria aegeria TaxID=348720 RepID=A0A8S4S7Y5_9NEOP|nr:jg15522 [Pararge aegeria aegeria]